MIISVKGLIMMTGLETNWNVPLASRASDLENLLALLNSTSPDFFPTTNFIINRRTLFITQNLAKAKQKK